MCDGMYGKRNMETCIVICKIRQPVGICYVAQGTQTRALWQPRQVGWGGRCEGFKRDRTHVSPWLIHCNVWQRPTQFCKAIILQLKKKKIRTLRNRQQSGGPQGLGAGTGNAEMWQRSREQAVRGTNSRDMMHSTADHSQQRRLLCVNTAKAVNLKLSHHQGNGRKWCSLTSAPSDSLWPHVL